MGDPLETIAFLTRSETRVTILRTLDTGPCDRRELETATDASRSTLSRALADLEERGWIRRDSGIYTITTRGAVILSRFVPLLETMAALETIDEGLDLLPIQEMEIDIRHFHDAELVTATEFDPVAPFEYGIERLRKSDTVRGVSHIVPPPYVRTLQQQVVTGELTAEVVLDREYIEIITNPSQRHQYDTTALSEGSEIVRRWHDIAAEADIRQYDGYIPYTLLRIDDMTHLWLCSDDGETVGLLESKNPTVCEWADITVTTYYEQAQPISPEMVA